MKRDNAFTGLEAAIVLIAFVVVAAVFSYVMLGAGFFATQKSQEVTYAGIKQSTSNVIPDGMIYGNVASSGASHFLNLIQVGLTIPVGGQTQNLENLVIVYSSAAHPTSYLVNLVDNYSTYNDTFDPLTGTLKVGKFYIKNYKAGDELMGPGDNRTIVIMLGNSASVLEGPSYGDWFQLEVKPQVGAPTTMKKTVPAGFTGGEII